MVNVYEIWRRAEEGPICPEKEFQLKRYWPRLNELVKEYNIKHDPEFIVPIDDTSIDNVFRAGVDLLLDVGILCHDTERIIHFDEDEIKEMLKTTPKEVTFGEGKDAVTLVPRKIEDKKQPKVLGGNGGAPVSEEAAQVIYEGVARERMVDMIMLGSPTTVGGLPVKAGSPMEMFAETMNIGWARTALRKVGRPGMPLFGSTAVSVGADVGCSIPDGWRKGDTRYVYILPDMETDYEQLSRAIHYKLHGSLSWGTGGAYLGGLAGGIDTSAVARVAATLALYLLYGVDACQVGIVDATYAGTTNRRVMTVINLIVAAITKNTDFCTFGYTSDLTYAGPCTDMCLYEIAAAVIAGVAVGCGSMNGVCPRQGIHTDYCTPVESKFMAEVAQAAVGIKREEANEMIKLLLSKYEDRIEKRNPPAGKKLQECYDMTRLAPSREYSELCKKIKKELQEIGLDFKY